MNFVLRRLGLALGKLELATLKETTLLKQVSLQSTCCHAVILTVLKAYNIGKRGSIAKAQSARTLQVKGLHAEYDRLASQKGRDSETRAGDAALEAAVKSSKDELSTLQVRSASS